MASFRAIALIVISICSGCFAAARADEARPNPGPAPQALEALLRQGGFAELDAMAADYRRSQARIVDGRWALSAFYNGLANLPDSAEEANVGFDARRRELERWLAAQPQSPTPRIALALLWKTYAWTQRGTEASAHVGQAQRLGFSEALATAESILAPVDPTLDPQVYSLRMQTAVRLSDPRPRLDALYAQAIKIFPDYVAYYANRYADLQERWFGRPGEAAAYAAQLGAAATTDEGKLIYFAVAARALDFEKSPARLLAASGISYPRLVEAFNALDRRIGVTDHDREVLAAYAAAAKEHSRISLISAAPGARDAADGARRRLASSLSQR